MRKPANERSETITRAEAVVEMLKAHGVEIIFGLCGDTSLPFYDALARLPHGMRHILTRDEHLSKALQKSQLIWKRRRGVRVKELSPGQWR